MHNTLKGKKKSSAFPNPLATPEEKASREYGLQYARAIQNQWGRSDDAKSVYRKRYNDFQKNRDYANGTQDTAIYKQLLNSLDPNNGDGTLLNLDWSPVPIIPKFVKIVVNKILSKDPSPNLQAIDPISSNEKDAKKRKIRMQVENKQFFEQMEASGVRTETSAKEIPDTLEEAEIFIDSNVKTDAEVAAQIATNMTLSWNNFNDSIYRRCVNDLVSCGLAVVKRNNDPNYGIKEEYVDPATFIHSHTEDPSFEDIVYAGSVKRMSIQELKRIAQDQFTPEEYEEIAKNYKGKFNNDTHFSREYNPRGPHTSGYEEFTVEVMDFEFISVDCMYYEEKESQYGNVGFYYKGNSYKEPENSVFSRKPYKLENATVYGGMYVIGSDKIFNYGLKTNVPKNIYDLTKARMSYSLVATNLRDSVPKSLVGGVIGFADLLQLTHLKLQQAIAKAKPDGLIVDIEGLENVQLGRGGELQPLEIQDIYEQTGVFYYRSKNPEGGFQNPPVRPLENTIRNINELIALYNHYLRMIRDATGINEMMDGTTPKGDTLVGVQQQAIAAGNNAIYDITHSSMILFKKVVDDIVKCLQVLSPDSVLYRVYEKAVGNTNMGVISSFRDLPMYNFGVHVQRDMDDKDRQYLEQNIQVALSRGEIDIEDAIGIRQLRDVDQAERLLIVRRKKRVKAQQQIAMQNSQQQAQIQQASAQATSQAKMQEMQMEAQLKAQEMQLKTQLESQLEQVKHQFRKEIELIKAQATLGFRTEEQEFKEKLEVLKEDRKDDRVKKQSAEQSKLISQRQGDRGELPESSDAAKITSELLG
jgi:hypothetical protein